MGQRTVCHLCFFYATSPHMSVCVCVRAACRHKKCRVCWQNLYGIACTIQNFLSLCVPIAETINQKNIYILFHIYSYANGATAPTTTNCLDFVNFYFYFYFYVFLLLHSNRTINGNAMKKEKNNYMYTAVCR